MRTRAFVLTTVLAWLLAGANGSLVAQGQPQAAPPAQPSHLLAKLLRLAGVIAVGDDHHRGAGIDHAPRMPAVERSEALADARAAADALVAQEGAFGTFLLEHDVCDPPLMFGAGGVLDVAAQPMLTAPGLGRFVLNLSNP